MFLTYFADCYVAVNGIPYFQKNSASIMVKFASECLSELKLVLQDLSVRLGDDTLGLEMRIGIVHGSVTAGVLRCEKGRFQVSHIRHK